jgi:hypothetical protein
MDVAVLDDEADDAVGRRHREFQAELRPVVVKPQGITLQAEGLREAAEPGGICLERVRKVLDSGSRAIAEPRSIRGDEAPPVGERRHHLAELERRRRIAVRQQKHGGVVGAGEAVEGLDAVHVDTRVAHPVERSHPSSPAAKPEPPVNVRIPAGRAAAE